MTVKEKKQQLFAETNEWIVHELTEKSGASKQMGHIVLNQLLKEGWVLDSGPYAKDCLSARLSANGSKAPGFRNSFYR